ncbi:peptidoglycan-binding protein [Kitasatospora purpeofusca]|uniref:peptidoglycan-binding protein n=1 Tax=Kitasatospora purpeofusca TaxID=67352 RepID=UPI002A59C154|nr:peptidoglycan-binding protein [Kitasatospora purpeofusca]MDY0811438.1 peptidoglycan-binding protein [Kitasatospora purpeofusca]
MATPLSADGFLNALRGEGLSVNEVGNWRTHNRNHKGQWGPVHGIVIHHTATTGTDASVQICRDGYAGLPGPLCHGVIDRDGGVHLVGYGRTNHAGAGDGDVLAAVVAERNLPPADQANTDGNARFYGFECINSGTGSEAWPNVQVEAMVRTAAAICRAHGWTERSVIGHKEWQAGKPDPRGVDMGEFRARVAALLGNRPTPPQPTGPPAFPGRDAFGLGKENDSILQLGQQLVRRGFGGAYKVGPSRSWGEADRLNVAAFQRAQGWSGSDTDGLPGPATWSRLWS